MALALAHGAWVTHRIAAAEPIRPVRAKRLRYFLQRETHGQ